MTKKMTLFYTVLMVGCLSTKTSFEKNSNKKNTIVYILPDNVNKLLKKQILITEKNIFICLYSRPDFYEVIVSKFIKTDDFYAVNTNRTVYVNGRFYPLIFDLDMIFGTPSDPVEIAKKFASEEYPLIKRTYIINEGYYIKFKSDGTIISDGNGLSKKN